MLYYLGHTTFLQVMKESSSRYGGHSRSILGGVFCFVLLFLALTESGTLAGLFSYCL